MNWVPRSARVGPSHLEPEPVLKPTDWLKAIPLEPGGGWPCTGVAVSLSEGSLGHRPPQGERLVGMEAEMGGGVSTSLGTPQSRWGACTRLSLMALLTLTLDIGLKDGETAMFCHLCCLVCGAWPVAPDTHAAECHGFKGVEYGNY